MSSQSAIWKLLDRLARDGLEAHDISVALAGLIYLRWADFQEAELEAIAAFDDTEYEPVLPATMHWRSWHALPPDELQELLAHQLPHALRSLNNSRHNPLATHLHRVASALETLGRLGPQSLHVLIRWLAEQAFETPGDRRALRDVLDSVLDKLVGKYSGSFRTPAAVTQLLIEMAAPNAGDRVYDPCFGFAGLLTAACDHILHKEKDRFGRGGAPAVTIFGVEYNPNSYVIGLTRLALSGIDDPRLELGNSLERTPSSNPERDGFDVVLANPPWGMRADPEGLDHFPIRTTDVTGLFIQHALSQLRPEGRAIIVVPQGVLFRKELQRLRRMLLDQHTLEAVVALPANAFVPYTEVSASILVLRRTGPTQRIRMIDAEALFDKGKGRQPATIQTEMVGQLGQKLRSPKPSEHCWDVDAESLAGVEWDLTPRRRDQSGLVVILDSLKPHLDVVQLKECCEILSGRAIKSEHLLEHPPRPRSPSILKEVTHHAAFHLPEVQEALRYAAHTGVSYVRIKDVKRGQADHGSLWLSKDALASLDARWKLRAGDVLLSKSGTIGKAGIVRNGAVGAIAASGFFVLRPNRDRLDPHFLLAYLDSSECRSWLDDMASGSSIRHLSKRVLEELPIPLPPAQLQQRVAKEHISNGVNVLAFLSELLTEGERDRISESIEKFAEFLPGSIDAINDPLDLSLLDRLAAEVRAIRNHAAHGQGGQSPLEVWILQFGEAVSKLRGIQNIPRCPGLLNVLQESVRSVRDSMGAIKGHLPNESKARKLTQLVASWLQTACSILLSDVKLILRSDIGPVQTGEMVETSMQIHNQGPLPLRNLSITTNPDWGRGESNYLPENGKITIGLTGAGPKNLGTFSLGVNWSALTLDGHTVSGSQEIAFSVVERSKKAEKQIKLDGSPYVCGDAITRDRNDVFFGREDLINQIRSQIIQSGNVVLLVGNRRTGKSSILRHLEGPNAVPGWMGVYCSFQGTEGSAEGEGVPTAEVFRGIAYAIADSLRQLDGSAPLPDGSALTTDRKLGIADSLRKGITNESPFLDFRFYLEVALDRLEERGLRLLLMLDEFDKLQEGIDSGVTSPQVPENIRFLIHQYPRLSAILTGSHTITRLRDEYWSALFGLTGLERKLDFLSDDAARQLVIEPVRGHLTYSHEAVELTLYLTSGQPYLLQCLCNRVFLIAEQLKTRSINRDLILEAAHDVTENNSYFGNFWEFAGTHRRRLILALAQRQSSNIDEFRFGVIQEYLLNYGIDIDDDALIADIKALRELDLIKLRGEGRGGHYILAIPLMGTWIEKHQDFSIILSEARSDTEDQHG